MGVSSIADGSKILNPKTIRPLSMIGPESFGDANRFMSFQSNNSLGLPRPNSVEFKRTFSAEMNNQTPAHMTHRRTQSYDTRQVRIAPSVMRNPSKLSQQSSFRSMMNTRESYAAPSYTGNALVERTVSIYRKGIIEDVIT